MTCQDDFERADYPEDMDDWTAAHFEVYFSEDPLCYPDVKDSDPNEPWSDPESTVE